MIPPFILSKMHQNNINATNGSSFFQYLENNFEQAKKLQILN